MTTENFSRNDLDNMTVVSRVFLALGDLSRQQIVHLFAKGERLNVGQIAAALTMTRSAATHHLKILKNAEVLQSEKVGKEVYFWVNTPFIKANLQSAVDYFRHAH